MAKVTWKPGTLLAPVPPALISCSYEGKDKDGNDVKITLFANSLTESGHQRDEYAFISNALFASFLTETPYAAAAGE